MVGRGYDLNVLTRNGEPWFSGPEVCRILGVALCGTTYANLDSSEQVVIEKRSGQATPLFVGTTARIKFISESGLYKLIMRSDKPQTKPFQDWVTKVVLPAIRKDGGYIMGEEKVVTGEMLLGSPWERGLSAKTRHQPLVFSLNARPNMQYSIHHDTSYLFGATSAPGSRVAIH